MARIKIITDSASDIPEYIEKKYNITILPICIIIDGKTYYDRQDIQGRDFIKKLADTDTIPTTSMVPMDLVENELRSNLEDYDYQIFITISSKASGEYNAINILKQQIEDETNKKSNIIILDSMSLSMPYGRVVTEMAKMAMAGSSLDDIMNVYYSGLKKSCVYFVVDDLKYLEKGGRIKSSSALIGSLLGIKPILTINDGLVEFIGKERGKQRAIDKIVELTVSQYDKDDKNNKIWIPNGNADETCEELKSIIKEKINPPDVEIYNLGCTIATHVGSGLFGIAFNKKGD
ncbi:MAG: DegV family protein [Clostridia bacterium]|nr:DegV family protein [Clostridia bacterium]